MSVKNEDGRRYIELQFEVPGSPEEVWQAIATGPGISAWFVPTELEERQGGALLFHLGDGLDSSGVVTAWEPPVRLVYEERAWAENAPPLATECIVQAHRSGSCVVRLISSLVASSADWDDQLESFESGWPPYFEILKLYMTHFKGQRSGTVRIMRATSLTEEQAWRIVDTTLGLSKAGARGTIQTPHGVPQLSGTVERVGGKNKHEALIHVKAPAPGLLLIGAYSWGGSVLTGVNLYLYGEQAPSVESLQTAWTAWLDANLAPVKQI